MLKFATVGAALAAILSTQVTSSLASVPEDVVNQWVQASNHKLVVTETSNTRTAVTNAKPAIIIADSSTNTPGVAEKIGPAGMMLGIAAVGGGAVGVILSARKANNPFKASTPESQENTIRLDQASRELQKKLLRLLHDDRDAAFRLVSQIKMKNPDRSINWCVEKVIYDLERDRGSY